MKKNMNYSKIKRIHSNKLLTISFLISIASVVIIMRIIELSLPSKDIKASSSNNNLIIQSNDRGLLLDRNNRILASNIYLYNLKAYPRQIKYPEKTFLKLSKEINFPAEQNVLKKLNNKRKYEVIISRNITAPLAKKINNIGIPGIEFIPVKKRFYPHKELTSHYVGHVNLEMNGVFGAERSFNKLLKNGENVNLAIDIRIQYAVRNELKKAIEKYKAKSATSIIIDINSGEILSLVSIPDFNPNLSIDSNSDSYRNTATLNLYEMGSTFKIFSIAAAIEKSEINLETKFDASKPIKISNHLIKDYHPQNRILSTKEIFLKSSNIGSSLIALKLGNIELKKFYKELGLLSLSKINLLEKTKPIIPKKWGEAETATLSFGHGLSISPIQMVEAASILFINNKTFVPTIKKVKNVNEINKTKIISKKTNNILKSLMYENTIEGTAQRAKIKGYYIGGKTATGEKVNDKGLYDKTKLVSSFLSVFPINEPKYISLVLFDEPTLGLKVNQSATGGLTAAPVTANILKKVLPLLGISKNINIEPKIIIKNKEKINLVSF